MLPLVQFPTNWLITRLIGLGAACVVISVMFLKIVLQGSGYLNFERRAPSQCLVNDNRFGQHRFIRLQESILHVVDSRTIGRPIIIFVHDIFQNWRTWIIQLEALHNRFRTVAIDLRGFGLSGRHSSLRQYSLDRMAQDIKQLAHILRSECICNQIDTGVEHSKCECKQQSITVCGVGLGGTLAWLLACDSRPEIDRTAIIGSPHPIAHLNSLKQSPLLCLISWFQAFAQLPVLPEMLLLANDLDIVRRRHCRYTNDSQLIKVQELHCLKASLSQPTAMTHALACYRSVSHFQHSILHQPKARVPVILLFGDLDPLCRWSLIQNSLEIAGKTQLFIIPESERYVHLDVSGRISQLISQFADDQNNNVHSLTLYSLADTVYPSFQTK